MGNQNGAPGGMGRGGRRGPTDEEREAERKRRIEERKFPVSNLAKFSERADSTQLTVASRMACDLTKSGRPFSHRDSI